MKVRVRFERIGMFYRAEFKEPMSYALLNLSSREWYSLGSYNLSANRMGEPVCPDWPRMAEQAWESY